MSSSPKIVDFAITRTLRGWNLYIPILTGHLSLDIDAGTNSKLEQFLETALNSPPRRLGDNPKVKHKSLGPAPVTDRTLPIESVSEERLCEDCPPVDYPTDKTRCEPCPRKLIEDDLRRPWRENMTGKNQKQDRPIEDLQAADAFRARLVERADGWNGPAPLWHGWAVFDAFLAGLDHARRS